MGIFDNGHSGTVLGAATMRNHEVAAPGPAPGPAPGHAAARGHTPKAAVAAYSLCASAYSPAWARDRGWGWS